MDKSSAGSSDSRDITPGCGSDLGAPPINLNITTTTGGSFTVLVDIQNSVENLKKIIAKKLKVAKDRICLLHRERELQDGTLKYNGLMEGSKIILIPNVETGLLGQRPENTVMQALESLNDSQVNDFLSGKTPLNLSMRLGDHMMLIQLQLSTVNPSSPSHTNSRSRSGQRSSRSSAAAVAAATSASANPVNSNGSNANGSVINNCISQSQSAIRKMEVDANNIRHNSSIGLDSSSSRLSSTASQDESSSSIGSIQSGELNSFLTKQDFESLQNIVKSLSIAQPSTSGCHADESRSSSCCSANLNSSFANESLLEQSPIKSLSNLVSSPIKTTSIKNIPITNNFTTDANCNSSSNERTAPTICSDPISAKLTSCLCKRLSNNTKACDMSQCQTRQTDGVSLKSTAGTLGTLSSLNSGDTSSNQGITTSTPNTKQVTSSSLLHKTANNPIGRLKHRQHHNSGNGTILRKTLNVEKNLMTQSIESITSPSISTVSDNVTPDSICELDESVSAINATDSRALAEASRNLTQTLRKLSKEVFTNKVDLSEETPRKSGSGAVIESMKNHGKGIYSGTFSGTLNPALQDRYGRPKRDISTVIHILNDLLSATPQYSRGARISFESPTVARGIKQASSKNLSSSLTNESCNKCFNGSKSGTCVYGECNGHYNSLSSSAALSTASTSSIDICRRNNGETSIGSCGCGSSLSLDTQSSILESSSSLSDLSATIGSDRNSSCTCIFRSSIASSLKATTNTSQDIGSNNGDKTICSKCSVELENSKTKCKLDQLRLVMQQSKQRREARKLKGAPYGARVLSTTSNNSGAASSGNASTTATANTIAPLASPSEVSPNHIVEEVNTVA